MRVQKWLARRGLASRRVADRWIVQGRLKINDQVINPGHQVPTHIRTITLDNQRLFTTDSATVTRLMEPPEHLYALFYKPSHTLVSTTAQGGMRTIYDLAALQHFCAQRTHGFVPAIGRLDYLSEGLMILSTDGELIQQYSHPAFKVPKVYVVGLSTALNSHQRRALRQGIMLDDGPSGSHQLTRFYEVLKWLGITTHSPHQRSASELIWYRWTLHDGRNRFIRRVLQAIGADLRRLVRIQKGTILLPQDLKPAELRVLSKQDFIDQSK